MTLAGYGPLRTRDGRCGEFWATLRVLSLAYVVIVSCNQLITLAKDKVIRAGEAVANAAFETRSCGSAA